MADPLSAIASVIALCQATGAILKGAQLIASLPKAPAEFHDLLNELTTTCLYLDDVHTTLAEIMSPTSPCRVRDLRFVTTAVGSLEARVADLNRFVAEFTGSAKGVDKNGHLRIQRVKWQSQKDRVRRQRDDIRQARSTLVEALQLLQSRQSLAYGHVIVRMQSTLNSAPGGSSVGARALPSLDALEDTEITETKTLMMGPPSSSSLIRGHIGPPAPYNRNSQARLKGGPRGYQVDAVAQERCTSLCKCQCHKVWASRSPDSLSGLIGQLALSYSMVPIWGTSSCTIPTCRQRPEKTTRLHYRFPPWVVKRAFHLTLSMANTMSLQLQIDFPRVVPYGGPVLGAVTQGSLERLQNLLSVGQASPMDIDEEGNSILFLAMLVDAWDIAEFLLDNRASVTQRQSSGGSPILYALYKRLRLGANGDWEGYNICERILQSEDQGNPDSTIFHDIAAGRMEMDLHGAIGASPASLNMLDPYGMAPIHYAALNTSLSNRIASIGMLLEKGAHVNLKNEIGQTALHFAIMSNSQELVEYLLDVGADVNICNLQGWSPLMLAVSRDQVSTVKLLVEAGADPRQREVHGETALRMLARKFQMDPRDTATLGHLLVRAGGDLEEQDDEGATPLLNAVECDNAECFRVLYRLGSRLDVSNVRGATVLHAAAKNGTEQLFTALREVVSDLRVDPDLKDMLGQTARRIFKWRIEYRGPSKQERPRRTSTSEDPPRLTEDEIDCFWALIDEIREYHDFPKGRSRRQQNSVGVAMPGGWSSDVEEADKGESEEEDEMERWINSVD